MNRRHGAVIAAVLVAASFAVTHKSAHVAHAAPAAPSADPSHRVYMMTDSVGLGAKNAVPAALPEYQVTVDGSPALFVEQLESKWLRLRMATAPSLIGDIAVVAGGYNYPYWDPARFDRSIDSMIATLRQAGVQHIIWVTLREVQPQYITAGAWKQVQPYYWYFPTVNDHLRRAVQRHPDLSLADWAAVANQPGLTYDAIHLNPAGAGLYSSVIADVVRNVTTELDGGTTTRVTVAGLNGVPADAKAVAINLTVTTPRAQGYITAYPCGIDRPATSNLNFTSDQTVAVSAIVNIGAGGQICVFNSERAHVLVDVQGYLAATSSYRTVSPARLVDTRETTGGAPLPAGIVYVVRIAGSGGIPADAAAVALNVTIVDNTAAGYATAYPCDAPPSQPIALVNYIPHTATPNFTIAKPAADGTICISANTAASIIVDAFGYFPAGSPITVTTPTRLLDTRPADAALAPGQTLTVPVVGAAGLPATAVAAVLTVTAAEPKGVGFVAAAPCGAPAGTSTLNVVPDRGTSNTAIVGPGVGGAVCIKSNTVTHVLVDVTGWVIDGYVGLAPWRALDSRVSAA